MNIMSTHNQYEDENIQQHNNSGIKLNLDFEDRIPVMFRNFSLKDCD